MYTNNHLRNGRLDVMTEVDHAQIDLINSNRVYSIITMSLGAILMYYLLSPQVDTPVFTYWIVTILLVDVFRLYAFAYFHKAKKLNKVDYAVADSHILIGTILSGLCWGGLGLILIPVVNGQSLMMVMLMLVVIAMASTTTLSYKRKFAVIFVLLVLFPLMFILTKQDYFVDTDLIFLETGLGVFILFLLKNAKSIYSSFRQMLVLQARSNEH